MCGLYLSTNSAQASWSADPWPYRRSRSVTRVPESLYSAMINGTQLPRPKVDLGNILARRRRSHNRIPTSDGEVKENARPSLDSRIPPLIDLKTFANQRNGSLFTKRRRHHG